MGDLLIDTPFESSTFEGEITLRGYFRNLLERLFEESEGFSAKRPFGNSDWEFELAGDLIKAGFLRGSFDEDDYDAPIFDWEDFDDLIKKALSEL